MYKEKIVHIFKSPAIGDIFRWSKSVHMSIVWICLLNLILSGSSLVITISTKGLIDGAVARDGGQVKLYALVMITTVLLIRICAVVNSMLNTKTNALLLKDMRAMMMHHLLNKQYPCIQGYHSGELVNRMFSDVEVVKSGITGIVPRLVSMGVSFIGGVIILVSMDWHLVVLLILGGILGLVLIVAFNEPMSSRHRDVQESEGRLHAFFQETLENMRLVKASGSENRMEYQADLRQKDFLKAQMKKGYFSGGMNGAISLVFNLSWLFCMLWGCKGIYEGVLTYGSLAAIIQLVGQIQGPISSAADIAAQAYGTIASAERLKEILDIPEEEGKPEVSGQELYQNLEKICISNLSFDYGRETVLKNVNAAIYPGYFVAVTGLSGSGKSTLFQLLLGIYQPVSGNVEFYFSDHVEAASKYMRPLFAYVPQGNTLFSGTLRENLLMFTDSAEEGEIEEAAAAACLDFLIETLDQGLDTMLGERGIGLSEGQAQRVAVARALLSKAPILLLDESTSALDEETEAKLLYNLSRMKEKTCLIVTHRKAALGICDYRFHIEDGNIVVSRNLSLTQKEVKGEINFCFKHIS